MRNPTFIEMKDIGSYALMTMVPIAFYCIPLFSALRATNQPWYLFLIGFLACTLMFLWNVRVGETGHVLCFGHDTGWRTWSGLFLMPSLFPFLRGFDIVIGWSVEAPSNHHHGNTMNIHHYQDQRLPTHQINTNTGMFGAMFGQLVTNFFSWLFNGRNPNGKFKYYKYGGIIYLLCWMPTFR